MIQTDHIGDTNKKVRHIEHTLEKIISQAHTKIIRRKGKDYAPTSNEIQKAIDATSFQKELSDQEIEEGSVDYIKGCDLDTIVERSFFRAGAKWYRKQIINQNK